MKKPITDLAGIENCPLHDNTPHAIFLVSKTQFSIARYYGGIKYNGDEYRYFSHLDALIRDDVLKWKIKRDKAVAKANDSQDVIKWT